MNRVASAFINQADQSSRLKSDFMERLCLLLAESTQNGGALSRETRVGRYLQDWPGDISFNGASIALRICGALHALKIAGNKELLAVYPPNEVSDKTLIDTVSDVVVTQGAKIIDFIQSPPQTNEVRRSVGLIAVGHLLTERYKLPVNALELGASAGLNLNWADYGLETEHGNLGNPNPALTLRTDWKGSLPKGEPANVIRARGVDVSPLDPKEDSLRLRAFIWPDQFERIETVEAAIAHSQNSGVAQNVVAQGDAAEWLSQELGVTQDPHSSTDCDNGQSSNSVDQQGSNVGCQNAIQMVYHTVAWQYFSASTRTNVRRIIETAGAQATETSPLAWVSMEVDTQGPGAALTMRLWPGDHAIALARIDFHGRWVIWQHGPEL